MRDETPQTSETSGTESVAEWTPTLGAWGEAGRVRFRVWAPEHASVELVLEDGHRPLTRDDRGYWSARFGDIRPGALYRYRLDGRDDRTFPDPASRFQPHGVHGPSQVVNPAAFRWTDHNWRPPHRGALVFYELHVGTFSPAGTFRGAMERLPYLAQLGVTALELMPLGDFPGDRNWGYDGVALFAPARCYGPPDELRGFVDAAHQHGLAVFLDVVYNHFGPDGAYANVFSPYYFTDRHSSPWGKGVNLDGPFSRDVRDFFIENALHWVHEYHIDGLRLDATHALQDDSPTHFLADLTTELENRSPRRPIVVAEDHRNLDEMLLDRPNGGWGLDAVWADDFHHQIRVHVAGDHEAYYRDFAGSAEDIATTIRLGWFYTGQHSTHLDERRGTDPHALDPRQFVICVQNHDQIGNRADGARLNHQVDAAVFRAVTTLLLTAPETPLLFMGQEWAASTPFLFFTDHHDELGHRVTKGRREEFAGFEAFADPRLRERIPDPQDGRTFEASRLRWEEMEREPHASMVRLYQRLLGLRATAASLRESGRDTFEACALDDETIRLKRETRALEGPERHREQVLVIARLDGQGTLVIPDAGAGEWQVLLTTEDRDLAPEPMPIEISTRDRITVRFARPGAVVLRGPAFAP